MAQDLRSKLAASGTLVVQRRGEKTLPVDVSLKVLRFATTQDLGCLGRTGTAWRDLSLRELTRLPGDWEVRRMAAPDHRVYFRSVAHERAQWEKPTRAVRKRRRRRQTSQPPRCRTPILKAFGATAAEISTAHLYSQR